MATDVGEIRARVTLNNVEFMRKIDESKKKAGELGDKAKKVSKDIKAIQKASLVVGGAVAAAIGGTVKMAADFEQKLQDIKAVSGATTEEMAKIHDLAIEMGAKTKYSAAEAAEGIEELIKAGVSLTDILNGGLEGALNLATAGELSLADAAQVASTALNAFRDDHLKVADAADILSGAANASATDVKEMAMGLSQASAVASGMGMTFKDTSTALALFAQYGLRGSDAGTSLKTMLLNLIPQTKQQKKLFEELGLVTKDGANIFYDANGKLKSFAEISGILHDKLKDLTNEQRQATLQILFGTDAVRAANIMFRAGADGVNQMWKEMSKVKAADVAKTKMDSLKGSFEEFRGALETLGISIGEDFLPVFRKVIDGATKLVESMGGVNKGIVETALASTGTASALALLGSTAFKAFSAISKFAFTPAGGVIVGLSLLGGAITGVKVAMDNYNKALDESANKSVDKYIANEKMIEEFDKLRSQNQLTNDELAEYLDLQTKITRETDPKKIAEMKDRMNELQKNSGLSNDEFDRMLDLNKKLTQNLPEATEKITEQGNRIADNTEKLKEHNRAYLEDAFDKYYTELNNAIDKAHKQQKITKQVQAELAEGLKQEAYIRDLINNKTDEQLEAIAKKKQAQLDANELTGKEKADTEQLVFLIQNGGRKALRNYLTGLIKNNDELQKQIDKQKEANKKVDEAVEKLTKVAFLEEGIEYKRGRGVDWLQKQIDKLEAQKKKLEETTSQSDKNTGAYKQQVEEIDNQIDKFQTVLEKVKDINKEAGKPITKTVKLKTDPSIVKIDDDLKKAVFKTVHLTVDQQRFLVNSTKAYNDMVRNRHQGGPVRPNAFELPKYHEGGSPAFDWTPPMFTERDIRVLGNEMILTEGQQANLFRWIKNAQLPQASADFTETNALLAAIERAIRESGGDIVVMLDGKQIEPSVSRAQGAAVRETKRRRGIV